MVAIANGRVFVKILVVSVDCCVSIVTERELGGIFENL